MQVSTSQTEILPSIQAIIWVLIGILLSLVLPVAVKTLQRAKLETTDKPSIWNRISEAWKRYGGSKYLGIFLAATLIAIFIVLLLDLKFYTIRDAALAGFAWESFVNKLFRESENS
ncbi:MULTISPECIES: hypothetical protein [unclassified Tolypothrix]|uniref:hypothetical protein n=1 Tax=unclassified Tolypothrix TaxID=2649714 RepID=UPI0005EAC14C|nr:MULTISPECIES: hypothetical protein [unclassified Tolypothrix]BAY95943.1 hypothetical protein NIES3275_80200 [Microchaete diplosiphon NIES-3275]EKE96530.1 hypothetical protein FDUTEX481_06601 [Tolypothrix sp. PCC 7601]MBE9084089.1 hypothetical protein [Tolypothrix sp. LEGE 11397]UYD31019.1 hypothetical protein HGR01_39770 [Tolypothrix sp. PCC 7712]UYD38874.1 hypothetical protein HG267_41035 [Tolypothrix sp. PCC 7601]